MSGDEPGGRDGGEGRGREPRLRDLARRLLREVDEREEPRRDEPRRAQPHGDEDEPEGEGTGGEEPRESEGERRRRRAEVREILGQLLATGNKTRAELIRLVAREVRFYLEAAELDAMLHDLVTNYSLEVNASLHLRPLSEDPPAPGARVGLRRRERAEGGPDPDEDGVAEED